MNIIGQNDLPRWNSLIMQWQLPASLCCRRDNGLPFEETLLYLRMESGDPTVLGNNWDNSLYIAAGKDPFILIEKAVAAAAQLSGGAQQRQDKQQPDSLNWFGWCTWDAYYSKVSARGKQACEHHSRWPIAAEHVPGCVVHAKFCPSVTAKAVQALRHAIRHKLSLIRGQCKARLCFPLETVSKYRCMPTLHVHSHHTDNCHNQHDLLRPKLLLPCNFACRAS